MTGMETLLPYFERELLLLRRDCREFAERYPRVAGRLQMSGESCEDPHVEHLIESVALLAARIAKRLDDDYPQFTEALFETLLPHYLRPFPSCAIVRLPAPALDGTVVRLARGTQMDSAPVRGVRCRFTSIYDMAVGGVTLEAAMFDSRPGTPPGVRLPPGATGAISMTFSHHGTPPPSLRVFIDGEPSFAAALHDALFMHTASAFVEGPDGLWSRLPALPLAPAGFAEADALLPFGARSHSAYRILGEYFACPEKFNFVDIDLAALQAGLPADCRHCTLHLILAGMPPDGDRARMLAALSRDNLLPGCSPVINLFGQSGVPIAVTRQKTDYAVLAHATHAHGYEVVAIDAVHLLRQRGGDSTLSEVRPLYSLRHGEQQAQEGPYWVMRHDAALAAGSPGHEKKITLVDADFNPLLNEKATLSLTLACSNRDLPLALRLGQRQGELQPCGGGAPVRLLRLPTPSRRLASGQGLHWRLISHLALNHRSLTQEGLPALREMLALYDLARSATSQRQVNGMVALEQQNTTAWLRHPRGASLVHGIAVRLTLDEEAFVGASVHLFVQVIDQFLGLYVHVNSFIELVALSLQSGEELIRCKPRSGMQHLA